MLSVLRNEYQNNHLSTIAELLHAETLTDFLGKADYLLVEGFKDAAAVMTGGVLEQHLKKLYRKHDRKSQCQRVSSDRSCPRSRETLGSRIGFQKIVL